MSAEASGTPDRDRRPGAIPVAPECPFCGGTETELFNAFGSQLSVSTYWCRACRCPFEFFKWGDGAREAAADPEGS